MDTEFDWLFFDGTEEECDFFSEDDFFWRVEDIEDFDEGFIEGFTEEFF